MTDRKLLQAVALLTTTALVPAAALAQDIGSATTLQTITFLGTGLPTTVLESPSSVTVIDEAEISRVAPADIGRVLESVPGIIIGEQGLQRIQIRGEAERRVLIKIDGQALTDHTDYGQPVLVDPLNIERIEIVRGASSVISGSRAIGGVVNIITKRGAPDTTAEISLRAGYFSATDGYRASASVGGTIGAFDYRVTASGANFNDRETPDRTLIPSGGDEDSLAAHLGFQIDPNQYVMFKAQQYNRAADVFTDDPALRINLPNRDLTKLAGFYEGRNLFPGVTLLTFDAYYQTVDRIFENDIDTGAPVIIPGAPQNVQGISDDDQSTWGFNLAGELNVFPVGRTFVGLEYENDNLDVDRLSILTEDPLIPTNPPIITREQRFEEANITTTSVYAQQEFNLSETLTAFLGARYYDVDASLDASTARPLTNSDDTRLLGSAGLVYTPNPDTAFRINISQGYSYAALGQLFLETSAAGQQVIGNPNLQPEKATTVELGARYDGPGLLIDATLFYTDSEDYITFGDAGGGALTYVNIPAAQNVGLELFCRSSDRRHRVLSLHLSHVAGSGV